MGRKLTVMAPTQEALEEYIPSVMAQIDEGFTSGYVDSDTWWDFDDEEEA